MPSSINIKPVNWWDIIDYLDHHEILLKKKIIICKFIVYVFNITSKWFGDEEGKKIKTWLIISETKRLMISV